MKHRFLLDENILYFAILGTDEFGKPDATSTQLVALVGANCHKIVANKFLIERYWHHLSGIIREAGRPKALEPVSFIVQLLKNSEKLAWEHDDGPDLPADVAVPAEDVEIVRLALLARARIVTGDGDLRDAVNGAASLGLEAITPAEALVLAADS